MMLNVGCTDPAAVNLAVEMHGWIKATDSTFMAVIRLLDSYAQQNQPISVTLGILLGSSVFFVYFSSDSPCLSVCRQRLDPSFGYENQSIEDVVPLLGLLNGKFGWLKRHPESR